MAFRRRNKSSHEISDETETETDAPEFEALTETEPVEAAPETEPADAASDEPVTIWNAGGQILEREGGPWDATDAPEDKLERVDLGGLLVPIVGGMELRAEIAEDQVVAVTLIIGRSAVQIQPFAAPRTIGIWSEVRAEIAAGISEQGGTAVEEAGRFGTELVAEVAVALPDGTNGMQTARFLGVDGPRWFLRSVITGEGAVDPATRKPLEDLLADVVVVRGEDAMAPRDPIALRLPEEVEVGEDGEAFDTGEDAEAVEDAGDDRTRDNFKPFERGPEITEIR